MKTGLLPGCFTQATISQLQIQNYKTNHFLIFNIMLLCWSLHCRKLYFLSNTKWDLATHDVQWEDQVIFLIYYSESVLSNYYKASMSLGHFLKWKNFLHISDVRQQYRQALALLHNRAICTSCLKWGVCTPGLVSWLREQREVSIHTGRLVFLFLHPDPPMCSHFVGKIWVAFWKVC